MCVGECKRGTLKAVAEDAVVVVAKYELARLILHVLCVYRHVVIKVSTFEQPDSTFELPSRACVWVLQPLPTVC